MKKAISFAIIFCLTTITFLSCKKEETPNNTTPDPCMTSPLELTTSTTPANACAPNNNGTITATGSGSSGYTYNLNGGAYQASNVFSGLTPGNYTVGIKDAAGCSKTRAVTVSTVASGPLLNNVVTLINARCANCHTNAGSDGNLNLDSKCNIVANWSSINNRCVVLGNMPRANPLNASEKAIITNWVNAGHGYTN
jgi:hypothetical protein